MTRNTQKDHDRVAQKVVNATPDIERDLERLKKLLDQLPADRRKSFDVWLNGKIEKDIDKLDPSKKSL
jgi:hypothetical protein